MKIIVNIDPLKTFTSAMPARGMLPYLLQERPQDQFLLLSRKGSIEKSPELQQLLKHLKVHSNWSLHIEERSTRQMNMLKLLAYPNYNRTSYSGDLYLNFDGDDLGPRNRPLITLLADLSVLVHPERSSHGKIGRRLRRVTFQHMAKYSDRIVVISKNTENDLKRYFPKAAHKTALIYNGIDDHWFHTERSSATPHSKPYWLWYGFNSVRKNLLGMMEAYKGAWERVGEGLPDWVMVISGEHGEIREWIEANALGEKIRLEAQQPLKELINWIDRSEGLLFPSFYEGFGLPVAEAMARGKRVICSEVSALPEISGGMGIYFDPKSQEGMTMALIKAVEDKAKLQAETYQAWAKQFSYQANAKQYSALIDEVLAQSGRMKKELSR